MPPANKVATEDKLLRSLIYGVPKTKKTWWACKWAELGFNVILLDGDDGSMITTQLSKAAQERILVVNLVMENARTVFAPFIAQFLRPNNPFTWDEQDKNKVYGVNPKHSNIKFDINLLTANDLVVVDGWRALSESSLFQFATENRIDLSDASKTEWDGFNFQGNFLNWVLARLHALPCQVIVIGHSTVYEKWDRRDKKNPKLIEQRTQPISCSGPHGKKLAGHFTDVLLFEQYSSTAYKINTGGDKDRDGGSRLFAPGMYDWDDLGPKEFAEKLGLKATGAPCMGAQWFAAGEEVPKSVAAPTLVVSNATAAPITAPQSGGIKGLLNRQKKT